MLTIIHITLFFIATSLIRTKNKIAFVRIHIPDCTISFFVCFLKMCPKSFISCIQWSSFITVINNPAQSSL